eukprot:2747294-Pleurochrysis_carterae.AAC.1
MGGRVRRNGERTDIKRRANGKQAGCALTNGRFRRYCASRADLTQSPPLSHVVPTRSPPDLRAIPCSISRAPAAAGSGGAGVAAAIRRSRSVERRGPSWCRRRRRGRTAPAE